MVQKPKALIGLANPNAWAFRLVPHLQPQCWFPALNPLLLVSAYMLTNCVCVSPVTLLIVIMTNAVA